MTDLLDVFVCPRCKGPLARADEHLACTACPGRYPLVADVPIFLDEADRPEFVPDPGISFPMAIHLAEVLHRTPGGFRDVVDAYYEYMRDKIDPGLWAYYRETTRNRVIATTSDEVTMIARSLGVVDVPFPPTRVALEFGCGWGFSLAALAIHRIVLPALRGARLVGFDLNPAILVVARRLLSDLGLEGISLAIADATKPLPLADASVDLIYSNGVVEHIPAQDALMQNLGRVLSPDSVLHFLIPNRYMIHPEPHFGVRWVGFFPRHLQCKYVAYRLGLPPAQVETILSYSPRDLAALMGRNFPDDVLLAIPCPPRDGAIWSRAFYRALGRFGVNRYHCVVRRCPGPTSADSLRGRLQLTSLLSGRPLRRAGVFLPPAAA